MNRLYSRSALSAITLLTLVAWLPLSLAQDYPTRGTSTTIISKLNAEVRKGIKLPEVIDMMPREGVDPVDGTPAELAEYLKSDVERYARIITIANLKPE